MSSRIPGLGVSLFVRDALRLDYCLQEAVHSVVPIAEQVVVMDCESTDGTTDLVRILAERHDNVEAVLGQPWEVAENYQRLMLHANKAREQLRTRWHLMLQADEVLHENSFEAIRLLVQQDGWGQDVFRVRRINLYGDCNRRVPPVSRYQPCSAEPARIGHQDVPACGDGESLVEHHGVFKYLQVVLFHYGFVRRSAAMIDKVLEMQSWFHGKHATPDPRVQRMADERRPFNYQEIIPSRELEPLTMPHPAAARSWVELHR